MINSPNSLKSPKTMDTKHIKTPEKIISCWYPSAGKDFKSIEMWLRSDHPNTLAPNLYFFTDSAYDIDGNSFRYLGQDLLENVNNMNSFYFLLHTFDIYANRIYRLSDDLIKKIITDNSELIIEYFDAKMPVLRKEIFTEYQQMIDNREIIADLLMDAGNLKLSCNIECAYITLVFTESYERAPYRNENTYLDLFAYPLNNNDFYVLIKDATIDCLYIKNTDAYLFDNIDNFAADLKASEIYCDKPYWESLKDKLQNYNQNKVPLYGMSDGFQNNHVYFINKAN